MQLKNIHSILNVNVTWFCPVKCRHCHIRSKASLFDKKTIDEEDIVKACEVAKELGFNEYRISGGEPTTLSEKLFDCADIIYDITGCKPNLLTSGYGIDDKWIKLAEGKFNGIFISVENPIDPLQKVVNVNGVLRLIREHHSESLNFRYGLTLITENHFKNIGEIFEILYENANEKFYPQLDYPSLLSFVQPKRDNLNILYHATQKLFRKHGVIPYYFPNLIGSLLYLDENLYRVLTNLNPDGKYDVFDGLSEAFQHEIKWREFCLEQQQNSDECNKCDWIDVCKFHSGFWKGIRYDWCQVRKKLFLGIFDGLNPSN